MNTINSPEIPTAAINIFSKTLGHEFIVNILFPPVNSSGNQRFKVLFLNDGQDLRQLQLRETLSNLYSQNKIEPIIVVAVNADERMKEYGIASRPDYKERGNLASGYSKFITAELMPFINYNCPTLIGTNNAAFAGFSLGALSALDIVWNHPDHFGKAGVFSGSLWWRRKDLQNGYKESDRIMHDKIRRSKKRDGLKFWFQTGTHDETHDRNNNGVIDSIDDTLDLIHELKKKGYDDTDIAYREIQNGTHDFRTWSAVMPDFLTWAFGKRHSS